MGRRRDGRPRWVLDPIDGTINFAQDSPLCAISLSLVLGGQPVLGIVDMPLLAERFIARQGGGAYLNGTRISVAEVPGLHGGDGRGGGLQGRRRLGGGEPRAPGRCSPGWPVGACACACWVGGARLRLAGGGAAERHAMLSNLPWDVTAGLLLVREAGGVVFDYDGSPHDGGPALHDRLDAVARGAVGRIVMESM